SLLVGASVVVIVLGTFKMAMTLLDGGSAPQLPPLESSSDQEPSVQPPVDTGTQPAIPDAGPASITVPTPNGRQSLDDRAGKGSDRAASLAMQTSTAPSPAPLSAGDVTGSVSLQQTSSGGRKLSLVQVPPSERLPDGIGGPVLRSAA